MTQIILFVTVEVLNKLHGDSYRNQVQAHLSDCSPRHVVGGFHR